MQSFSKFLGITLVVLGLNLVVLSNVHAQEEANLALKIMEIAGKAWDIVEANKPTADVSTQAASALPEGSNSNWMALTGWRPETSVHASLPLKNHYGQNAIDLEYDLRVLAGGNLNGKGAYIASARIIPTVKVSWSYNLTVKATVSSITNAGTADNPNAAVVIDIVYNFGSTFLDQSGTDSFLIRGDGLIQHLNDGKVLVQPSPMPVVVDAPVKPAEITSPVDIAEADFQLY